MLQVRSGANSQQENPRGDELSRIYLQYTKIHFLVSNIMFAQRSVHFQINTDSAVSCLKSLHVHMLHHSNTWNINPHLIFSEFQIRTETIYRVTRLLKVLDANDLFVASFNSHQHVLLSSRPVSHGQLLLSHKVRTFVAAWFDGENNGVKSEKNV